ncbi:hypothetical protein [Fibrella forsythiae]|uniref:Uncharacterized protein n=1 Tax=Fibrella forsythiae TaxID=2817061 RepID=A0ABS3JKP9_9BACT|nr:hypothetical protein [Fibrella forsythiae]MBO0950591.1 hypothetical protein [Fibrella forsythiae]
MQPIDQAEAYLQSVIGKWIGLTSREVDELLRNEQSSTAFKKVMLSAVGLFLTPITLARALPGFTCAYNRFMRHLSIPSTIANLMPISRFAIFLGSLMIWVALFILFILVIRFAAILGIGGRFLLIFSASTSSSRSSCSGLIGGGGLGLTIC